MKIAPVDEFLRFLDEQDPTSIRQGAIDSYLASHQVDPDDLLSFVFFCENTFARNLVHRAKYCELLILTWLPGNRTSIRDHGGQRGWISLHTGELNFKTYSPITDEGTLPPQIGAADHQTGDELIYIDDTVGIHSIANLSRKPAISMHLYAGPMHRCRVYDERAKRFTWKEQSYFTQNGRQARTHVLELD